MCFVDFAKAFDSVYHNLLWKTLSYLRVSRKLLSILQNMYSKANARVIMLSEPFLKELGRMQPESTSAQPACFLMIFQYICSLGSSLVYPNFRERVWLSDHPSPWLHTVVFPLLSILSRPVPLLFYERVWLSQTN